MDRGRNFIEDLDFGSAWIEDLEILALHGDCASVTVLAPGRVVVFHITRDLLSKVEDIIRRSLSLRVARSIGAES